MAKVSKVQVELAYGGFTNGSYAEIERNKSIRLVGSYFSRPVDVTFKVGDYAEYDSYNLSYYGQIVSITDKTVTIQKRYSARKHRLPIDRFAWRNYNFNLEAVQQQNAEISMYL